MELSSSFHVDGDDVDIDSAAVVSDVVVAVRFGSTTSFDESFNGIERMPLASLDQCGTLQEGNVILIQETDSFLAYIIPDRILRYRKVIAVAYFIKRLSPSTFKLRIIIAVVVSGVFMMYCISYLYRFIL